VKLPPDNIIRSVEKISEKFAFLRSGHVFGARQDVVNMTSQVIAPIYSVNARLTWADFCRVCAIFGVIVIHASVQLLQPRG
jgi:hypothetical protein